MIIWVKGEKDQTESRAYRVLLLSINEYILVGLNMRSWFPSNETRGNSTLILVQVCSWDFSNLPYSCIPDFRNVYLFMYDLFTVATHKSMYLYVLLTYQPYRCIEMSNLVTYWCIAAVKRGAIPASHVYHALYKELPPQAMDQRLCPQIAETNIKDVDVPFCMN